MDAAIYCRVSTDKQNTENQNLELTKVAKRLGWNVVAVYSDTASGATDSRPQLDQMMESVSRKEIDIVMAWSVDRLSRSLQHLVTMLTAMHQRKINLYLHQQNIDTSSPSWKMLFQLLGVFAEFETSMIRERVMAGLDRARSQGKRLGRPPVPPILIEKMKRMRKEGMTLTAIDKKVGVAVGKVHQCV